VVFSICGQQVTKERKGWHHSYVTLESTESTALISCAPRDTAAPLIEGLGIELRLYDSGNLEELAKELLLVSGRYLVVGHSNTTPGLAQLLGAEPGSDIADNEYDRLYVLVHRPGCGGGGE